MATSNENERAELDPQDWVPLLRELVNSTYSVNKSLGDILAHSAGVLRRQNLLIALCIVAMALMICQIFLGLTLQYQQKAVSTQLLIVDDARRNLSAEVSAANKNVKEMLAQLELVKKQMDAAPTVTTDKSGKLGLSFPLDAETKRSVEVHTDAPAPEKVVIPLKPSQTRLEK